MISAAFIFDVKGCEANVKLLTFCSLASIKSQIPER